MGNCQREKYTFSSSLIVDSEPIHRGSILGLCRVKDCLSTCSDDKRIAMVEIDETTQAKKCVTYLEGHSKPVNKVIFHSNCIHTCSRDLSIKTWDMLSNRCINSIENAHDLNVSSIVMHSSNNSIFSGSRDYKVKGWNIESNQCVIEYSAPRNIVTAMNFSSNDSNILYQCSEDLCIRVWDVRNKNNLPSNQIKGFIYFPISMDINNNYLVTGCKGFHLLNGCDVKIYDVRNTKDVLLTISNIHSQDVTGVTLTAQGDHVVSISKDGSIHAHNIITNQNSGNMNLNKYLTCISSSKESNYTAAASDLVLSNSSLRGEQFYVGSFDGSVSSIRFHKSPAAGQSDGYAFSSIQLSCPYSSSFETDEDKGVH